MNRDQCSVTKQRRFGGKLARCKLKSSHSGPHIAGTHKSKNRIVWK